MDGPAEPALFRESVSMLCRRVVVGEGKEGGAFRLEAHEQDQDRPGYMTGNRADFGINGGLTPPEAR